jgi:hypothetical protein
MFSRAHPVISRRQLGVVGHRFNRFGNVFEFLGFRVNKNGADTFPMPALITSISRVSGVLRPARSEIWKGIVR